MSFSSAQDARLILGDFALSDYTTKVGVAATIDMLETTVLSAGAKTRIPGLKDAKFSIAGNLDNAGATTGQHRQIFDQLAASSADPFSYAPNGFALGNTTILGVPRESNYPLDTPVDGLATWTLELTGDDLVDFAGVSLADLAAVTSTTTGTGVDNSASSSNGGAAILHVTAYSGFSSVAFKVQHSTDNLSWSDLISFTSVTAVTAEHKTVTGTVDQYVRSLATVSGTGSVTFQMSFARR